MAQFRKKPVEITAYQLPVYKDDPGTIQAAKDLAKWCGGSLEVEGKAGQQQEFAVYIKTLEGTMKASERDWIIRGVQGEFYPCKPDIFHETYEPLPAAEIPQRLAEMRAKP